MTFADETGTCWTVTELPAPGPDRMFRCRRTDRGVEYAVTVGTTGWAACPCRFRPPCPHAELARRYLAAEAEGDARVPRYGASPWPRKR